VYQELFDLRVSALAGQQHSAEAVIGVIKAQVETVRQRTVAAVLIVRVQAPLKKAAVKLLVAEERKQNSEDQWRKHR
jgi:hypothetical protein